MISRRQEPTYGEYNGEYVENDVCHSVLCKCLDAGILDEAAEEPTQCFDQDCTGHNDNGWKTELDDRMITRVQALNTFQRYLEKRCDHNN